MADHCVEIDKNRIQSAAKVWKWKIWSWKILFQTKVLLKYHSYQMNGNLFYFIFTLDQDATNYISNYEYVDIKGEDI